MRKGKQSTRLRWKQSSIAIFMIVSAAFTMVFLAVVATRVHRRLVAEQSEKKPAARATEVRPSAVLEDIPSQMPGADDYLNPLVPPGPAPGASQTVQDLAAALGATTADPAASRVYRAFRLGPSPQATYLDGIALRLAQADPKRRRFTLVLQAGGREVVEPHRAVNERIQFRVAWAQQPYEVEINELSEAGAEGRLWAPQLTPDPQ